jgi:hypothetical protein
MSDLYLVWALLSLIVFQLVVIHSRSEGEFLSKWTVADWGMSIIISFFFPIGFLFLFLFVVVPWFPNTVIPELLKERHLDLKYKKNL